MKIRTMLLAATLTLGSIMTVSGLAHSLAASSMPTPTKVFLQCRNYGGQQDVSKNPDIINTTNKTLPTGRKLFWAASDGDKGSIVLEAPLPPKGKIGVLGQPGQSYTCQAWYWKY